MKKFLSILLVVFCLYCTPILATTAEVSSPIEQESLFSTIEKWYDNNMNYGTITLLMTVESSFIPFPSEIVIPPAAYIASKNGASITLFGVVIFGTLGALLGAIINYLLAMFLGRSIIYAFTDSKLGKLCLLSSEKVQKAETYFNKYGNISTFIGRMLPAIRQLISIPAGLAKMNFFAFCFFTTLGAGIWNSVLAFVGYMAQGQQELIHEYMNRYNREFIIIVAIAIVVFIAFKLIYNRKKKTHQ